LVDGEGGALHANWVRYGPTADPAAAASPYQSQDATLINGVAAQLTAEAELRVVRAQINPHFLFNSLKSVADMAKDGPLTEQAIPYLARIFRHALDSTRQSTGRVSSEEAFLTAYLDIERLRFEQRLTDTVDFPPELSTFPVPTMLIQPLVENALRHSIGLQLAGGAIIVNISLPAARLIGFTVAGAGAGFQAQQPGVGVGLTNVQQRVEALPGGRFTVTSTPGAGTRVTLEWNPQCES